MPELGTYILDIDRPLPTRYVAMIDLDGSGADGDARFPYTWAKLTAAERRRLCQAAFRLNEPMVAKLRGCAASTRGEWGKVTVYTPEARELVGLIDMFAEEPGAAAAQNCLNCGESADHQHCANCGEAVYTVSSRHWCDGCEEQATPVMPAARLHPLAVPIRGLATLLSQIGEAWNAEVEAVTNPDEREALMGALIEAFPFTMSIEEAAAAARDWEEHVYAVLRNPPSVLSLAARELEADVAAVTKDIRERTPNGSSADDEYRQLFNGLMGGRFGKVGGTFTPTVLSLLAALLQEIHHSGDQKVRVAAVDFARALRDSRKESVDL